MPVYSISSPMSLLLRELITFVEGNVLCKYDMFQLNPPYDFWEEEF